MGTTRTVFDVVRACNNAFHPAPMILGRFMTEDEANKFAEEEIAKIEHGLTSITVLKRFVTE